MKSPADLYREAGALADRALVGIGAFAAFNLVAGALLAVSYNASSYFVGIVAIWVLLLGAGTADRAWRALHAKLDAIIAALPAVDNALLRAEERDAAEIEELRR